MKKETVLLDAVTRMAMSLRPEHWQAIVATKKIPYPHTAVERVRAMKNLIMDERNAPQVQKQ